MFGSDKTKKQAMQKAVAKNVQSARIRNQMIKAEKADKGKKK